MPLILTDRDDKILAMCGEYGIVDRTLIHRLFWPGKVLRVCQKRLQKLVGAKLLHVVELNVSRRHYNGGSLPSLFALTPQGAGVLEHRTGIVAARVQGTNCSPATFYHRRECVALRYTWDEGCRLERMPATDWIMEQDTRNDVPADASPNEHRRLYHAFKTSERTVTCRPDLASLTLLPAASSEPETCFDQLLIAWEIDLGTERHQQVLNKIPGYVHWLRRNSFQEYFSLQSPAVRIFWVCKTEQRMHELRRLITPTAVADGCRFGCFPMLTSESIFRHPVWWSTDAGPFTLLR